MRKKTKQSWTKDGWAGRSGNERGNLWYGRRKPRLKLNRQEQESRSDPATSQQSNTSSPQADRVPKHTNQRILGPQNRAMTLTRSFQESTLPSHEAIKSPT